MDEDGCGGSGAERGQREHQGRGRLPSEHVTRKQVLDIVKMKKNDLNATNDEAAFRVISGTARSMGIEVVG